MGSTKMEVLGHTKGRYGRDSILKFTNSSGAVIMRRKRKMNGQGYNYTRLHSADCLLKSRKSGGKKMTNAKKESVLFVLNMLKTGMTEAEIREDILMDRIECSPEYMEYYAQAARCVDKGEPVPEKPDFKALKVARIKAENEARLKTAEQS